MTSARVEFRLLVAAVALVLAIATVGCGSSSNDTDAIEEVIRTFVTTNSLQEACDQLDPNFLSQAETASGNGQCAAGLSKVAFRDPHARIGKITVQEGRAVVSTSGTFQGMSYRAHFDLLQEGNAWRISSLSVKSLGLGG